MTPDPKATPATFKCSAHAIERCRASACRTEFREMHAEAEIEGLREKIATLEAREGFLKIQVSDLSDACRELRARINELQGKR